MKLRFRANSLRLRLNRREVADLASGVSLRERVDFPGNAGLSYVLEPSTSADVGFREATIRVRAPQTLVAEWAAGDSVGMYFEFPANGTVLRVAIEKDLECVEGAPEERDPEAFPRGGTSKC
jgi:hypothetical protein